MIDEHILNASKTSYRQAGRDMGGKIVKGFIQDPTVKSTTSSIPYKFETIIYRNENPKGFGTTAQRFSTHEDQAPGPGSYSNDVIEVVRGLSAPSFSKKGYGNGFASSAVRKLYDGPLKGGPGPGAYSIKDKPFQFTKLDTTTSSFVSGKTEASSVKHKKDTPGPGYYNPDKIHYATARDLHSVFGSKSQRLDSKVQETPPPGNYELTRTMLIQKPYKHFFGNASFMPPTRKRVSEKEHVNELLGKKPENFKLTPGPGAYFSDKVDPRVAYQKSLNDKKVYSAFAETNLDRFGAVIHPIADKPALPGPGAYNVVKPEVEKAIVSGSVFMSESMRQPFGKISGHLGPTNYNPQILPKKKSYHLNVKRQWV